MPSLKHGLLQIYTGDGKGKTTAAVGQAVRARGAGLAVCFVQFIKGGPQSSELAVMQSLGIEVMRPADADTGLLRKGLTAEDRRAARATWDHAAAAIAGGAWDIVLCDELNVALHYQLVDLSAVLEALAHRPAHVEVIITGRNAPVMLRDAADLITEMTLVKHPFTAGIPARKGIEY